MKPQLQVYPKRSGVKSHMFYPLKGIALFSSKLNSGSMSGVIHFYSDKV